tara:strand:- start:16 stop:471 length:456 start_codon:yes stop_codon:yes gene_type:complete
LFDVIFGIKVNGRIGEIGIGFGVDDAGIDQMFDPGGLGGINRSAVLGNARGIVGFTRNDQGGVDILEGRGHQSKVIKVAVPDVNAFGRQIIGLGWCADTDRDVTCGDAIKQVRDNEAAELAGGAGNQCFHFVFSDVWWSGYRLFMGEIWTE